MNILSRVFGNRKPTGRPTPSPQGDPGFHQQFKVEDGQLRFNAHTLDEFYTRAEACQNAQRLLDAMSYADELKRDDQKSLDQDSRPGHVALPQEKFESNPGGYVHENGGIHTAGDENTSWTTHVDDGYAFTQQQASWDKLNQTFDYHYQAKPLPDWGTGGKSLVAEGEFPVSTVGQVATPDPNQGPVHEARLQGLMADRVRALLEAASFWENQGLALDQTAQDFNPKAEGVVAPNVARGALEGLDSERALSQAFTVKDGQPNPYQSFDIEAHPQGFVVAANDFHHSRPYGAKLVGSRSPEGLSVILERPEEGSVEKASWNFASGRVKYERLEKG